jgi:hypothetical protein
MTPGWRYTVDRRKITGSADAVAEFLAVGDRVNEELEARDKLIEDLTASSLAQQELISTLYSELSKERLRGIEYLQTLGASAEKRADAYFEDKIALIRRVGELESALLRIAKRGDESTYHEARAIVGLTPTEEQ